MLRKYKCGTCGRSYVNIEAHILKNHTADTTGVDNDPETATTNTGYVVKTSHNTPNPDAPPPSYAPATSHKETP